MSLSLFKNRQICLYKVLSTFSIPISLPDLLLFSHLVDLWSSPQLQITHTHMRTHTHGHRQIATQGWCVYLRASRPAKWYKCHSWGLWSDQRTAHQQHTMILISRLLLWPLPPLNQTLLHPHICRKRFDGNDGKDKDKRKIGIRPIRPLYGLNHCFFYFELFITLVCAGCTHGICVHPDQWEEEGRVRRRRGT